MLPCTYHQLHLLQGPEMSLLQLDPWILGALLSLPANTALAKLNSPHTAKGSPRCTKAYFYATPTCISTRSHNLTFCDFKDWTFFHLLYASLTAIYFWSKILRRLSNYLITSVGPDSPWMTDTFSMTATSLGDNWTVSNDIPICFDRDILFLLATQK